jgi:microcystin-dependent protein
MSDPFVAEIRMFAGNFAPKGWAQCNGQLLPISQNTALFSLLGTFYGGDGKSTFALPNLEGSVPIGQGKSSASGSDYFLGESSGTDSVTLLTAEMPLHTHILNAHTPDQADLLTPTAASVLAKANPGNGYNSTATGLQNMAFQELTPAGGSLPHNNMMPYLTVTFIIAQQGVFPPRG